MQLALRLFTCCAIVVSLLAHAAVAAQPAKTPGTPPPTYFAPQLGLAELEGMALAHQPAVRQAEARYEAAQGRACQAGVYPNPRLMYEGTEITAGSAGFQGGSISQEIILGGKRRLDMAAACAEVQRAEAELAAAQHRVRADVQIEFYNVLAAQRTIDLWTELLALGDRGVKATQQLFDAQQVAKVDVLQAQVERDTAYLQYEGARQAHAAAWRRLTAVVGLPELVPTALTGDLEANLPEIDWESAKARLLGESPEIAAAVAAAQRAEWMLCRAQKERIPNVEVAVGYQHDNTAGEDVTNVSASFPLPLFNRNQGNICAAAAELDAAQLEIQRRELRLQNKLASVYERYAQAKVTADRYASTILKNAQASLDLVKQGYPAEFGFLHLLSAQRTYFQARLEYLKALREVRESAAAIDGLLLTGTLDMAGE